MRYAFAQRLPFATQPVPKTAAAEEAEEAEEAIWHVASARGRTTAHVCALESSNAFADEGLLIAQASPTTRTAESKHSALSDRSAADAIDARSERDDTQRATSAL